MADLQKTVEIVFGGRNDLSKAIGSVERSVNSINFATQPFADAVVDIGKVQLAAQGSILAMGGYAVNAAATWSSGMNEIHTLMSGYNGSIEDFDAGLLAYASTSTQNMKDVQLAAYQAISAGIEPPDLTKFLGVAEKLAVAGKSSLSEAVGLLAGTANAYGQDMDGVKLSADLFFTAVKDGVTTIPELSNAMGNVSGYAASYGVSVASVAAALSSLTAYGASSTDIAATSLRALIQGLVTPTQQAAKAAKNLGINLGADIFKDHTLAEVLDEIGKKTGYSSGEIAKIIPNVEGLKAALPLIKDPAQKFKDAMADMGTAAGSVEVAYGTMIDNIDLMKTTVVNGLHGLAIQIGAPMVDEFNAAIKAIAGVFSSAQFAISDDALKPVTDFVNKLLKSLSDNADAIARVFPDAVAKLNFDGLISSYENLGGALNSLLSSMLGEDIDLTTADGLSRALQGIVDALSGLNNISAGILTALPPVLTAIADFAKYISEIDGDNMILVGKALGALFVVNIAMGTVTSIISFTTAMAGLATIEWAAIGAGISGFLVAAAPILYPAAAIGAAGVAGAGIGTLINNEIDDAVSYFTDGSNDSLGGLVYDWVHGGDDQVATAVTHLVKPIKDIPTDVAKIADETAVIGWEIDKNGEMITSTEAMTNSVAVKLATLASKETIVKIKTEAEIDIADIEAKTERVKAALQLEGLKTTETTKRIESMYDFNSTAVIAEADKITSAFDASASAIGSVSGALGTMIGSLAGSSWSDNIAIKDSISKEQAGQTKLIDAQTRMMNAQSKTLEIKNNKLQSGEALIKIDSSGLEPALEQVLWSIIEKAKIKMAMEETELLLGI